MSKAIMKNKGSPCSWQHVRVVMPKPRQPQKVVCRVLTLHGLTGLAFASQMSGLSPTEVVSTFPWSSPLFQWVEGEPFFTEMPGCLISWWRQTTCITVAVCRSKHGTCLSRRTCLTTNPLQKLAAFFSATVVTLSIKTLCQLNISWQCSAFR